MSPRFVDSGRTDVSSVPRMLAFDPSRNPKYPTWDESTSNQSTQDESTSDQSTQDESTSDQSTQDESTSDQSTQDESTSDQSTQVESTSSNGRQLVLTRRADCVTPLGTSVGVTTAFSFAPLPTCPSWSSTPGETASDR